MDLQYRDNNYFNEKDLFIFYSGYKLWITKIHLYNGNWYSDVACKYKMTSVRSINSIELYHTNVEFKGVKGVISKFLDTPNNDIGVMWESGETIRKYGLPPYWNDINNLIYL